MADEPELRPGPPWVMEEMVAAEPGLARTLLESPPDGVPALAGSVREAYDAGLPVTVVGCGTSEHGAMAVAALVDAALGGNWPAAAVPRQSLEAAERPQRGGICIGLSHDGGTRATTLALEEAAAAGARTALITARPGGSASGPAELVLVTPVHDDSWCHTIGYTSPILVGAALARELGLDVDAGEAEALLREALDAPPDAAPLAGCERLVCAGAGLDYITARELELKLAEGTRVSTAAHQLETVLHGHLAGEDSGTGLVIVRTATSPRVARRAELVAAAAREIGMPVVEIGRPSEAPLTRLLVGAAALQGLTLGLVHARAVNPDLIRREEPAYGRAGSVGDADW
ncbi:MAG TPA: SIS domain-containing protein [Solirubrobacteraceae bacterium]|nr:SIS domain-containing protein [Solirubrobacteraceae bacterium]